MKKACLALAALIGFASAGQAQYATLTGTLQASNGLPAANYTLSFTPSQLGFIAGTGVVLNSATFCATSSDGSVVGVINPLAKPPVTVGFTGTLPPANYYVKIAFYDASGNLTKSSPETVIQLTATGRLIVAQPASGLPSGTVGMKVYIASSTNAETLQGQTTGSASFIQSVPLTSGAAAPTANTTLCKQVANDTIWPSGTGYTVALTDTSGNTLPGYPMMWQIMGANTTINLSNGLPYYHGTVYFPSPILATPINHAIQSITGPLSLSGYNLLNVGQIGLGTTLAGWPIDVENGAINAVGGFVYNGHAPVNHLLVGNGTAYVDSATVPSSALSGLSLYYQTLQFNGTGAVQAPAANFSTRFQYSNGTNVTNIDLANVGTAGTYTYPTSVTTDSFGRVTAIASGSTVGRTCNSNGCYRVEQDGTIQQWGTLYCAGTSCSLTFPASFTTTTNLAITPGIEVSIGNVTTTLSGTTTTGTTFTSFGVVEVGGGGSAYTGGGTYRWYAIGN